MRRYSVGWIACLAWLGTLVGASITEGQPAPAAPAPASETSPAPSANPAATNPHGRSMHPGPAPSTAPRTYRIETDGAAKNVVDEILKWFDLSATYLIFVTDDSDDTSNAVARFDPLTRKRSITFNSEFMRKITDAEGRWAAYAVAAHELGHHIRFHLENTRTLTSMAMVHAAELDADFVSGFVLGRMGASYMETIAALKHYPKSPEHPDREQRRNEAARGWKEATGKAEPVPVVVAGGEAQPSRPAAAPPAAPGSGQPTEAARRGPSPPRQTREDRASILGKFDWKYNRDIYGEDIALTDGKPGIPGLALDECARRCDANTQCKAFSFDAWFGMCFHKGKVMTSLVDPPSILGVKKPGQLPLVSKAPTRIQITRNKVFKDPPASETYVDSFEACSLACEQDTRCIAFSFTKRTKVCATFPRSEGPYADSGVDSGYKKHEPQTGSRG